MKRKKQTLGYNEVSLSVDMVEKMATELETATQAIEVFGGYLLTHLDTAINVSPATDPQLVPFRDSVAGFVQRYREARPHIEHACHGLRTLVAMKRSQMARGSARVM